jgi:hypothetical protein
MTDMFSTFIRACGMQILQKHPELSKALATNVLLVSRNSKLRMVAFEITSTRASRDVLKLEKEPING